MTHSTDHIAGEPILFGDQRLHALYFTQPGTTRSAALLVPPLFEERRCAHRALVCCARALAQHGIRVMLPDVHGTGNSRGHLDEIGIERWQDDLLAALGELRMRAGQAPLTVIGCRAGALLAAHGINSGWPAQRFVLWQPVTDGRSYLNQLRTRRMIQDKMTGDDPPVTGAHEVEGHSLSPALFAGLQVLRLPAVIPPCTLRLLQCSFNDRLLTEYSCLIEMWGEERLQVTRFVCEPFWHPHTPGEYEDLAQAIVQEVLA